MALNLADGQLAASSGTLLGVDSRGNERTVSLILFNTSGSATETVLLTILRSGSTARTIARAKLGPYETMQVNGIALDGSDLLAGYATDASMVDYTIGQGQGPFSVTVRDASGAPKATQAIEVTIPASEDLTPGEVKISGLLDDIRSALLKIA